MSSKKRSAILQLTKEQDEEDEIEEVTPAQGFKKADESVLASRPMRGLPKRNNAFGVTNDAPSIEKKSNFAFGEPISSAPFTFNASLPTSASTSSTTQPAPASSGFKFSAPAVSASASTASKQLSSLLGPSPQPNGRHGSEPSTSPSTTAKDNAESKYYTSLRGLNQAFKEEIWKRLYSDPFTDFGESLDATLDAYKIYRTKIQKEYDASKPQNPSQADGTVPFVFGSKSAAAPAQPFSMPTPPKSFAGFGATSTSITTSTTTSSVPASGGFKPNFGATSSTSMPPSSFTFGATSTKTEKTTVDPSLFAASSSTTSNAKPSPFGASATTNKPSPFGAPATTSSPFGFSSTSASDKPFNLFGSGTGTSSSTKVDTPSNTTTVPPNIFGSGGSAGASGNGAGSSSTPASSSGGFSFGGVKSPSSGNLGNPVGFSFGSKEENAKEPASTAAGASTSIFSTVPKPLGPSGSSGFSFGSSSSVASLGGNQDVPAKSSAPGSVASASAMDSRGSTPFSTEGGEAPPPEDSSTPKPLGENPNDLEGEGEENEETVHTSRVKIYRFGKKGDQPHWADIGVGMLRIKKHKETNAMRLLSRNSANGKIMMNFRLYTGFKVSRAKQVLNFVGHDEGANVTFRVRVKDEAGAIELQEAIERAVASL